MNDIYIKNEKGYMFTGLYDKHGTSIYHYDILEYNDGTLIERHNVSFNSGCFWCDDQPLYELALESQWSVKR